MSIYQEASEKLKCDTDSADLIVRWAVQRRLNSKSMISLCHDSLKKQNIWFSDLRGVGAGEGGKRL